MMVDFIEQGTERGTNIKVKTETLQKKSEMYFSYCIESKGFIYVFSNWSVKWNIDEKIINMKAKNAQISGTFTFQS